MLCPICENGGKIPPKTFYLAHRNTKWMLCSEHSEEYFDELEGELENENL